MGSNKCVSVGLVGLGRLGRQHAENLAFRIPNCRLAAVCSIKTEEVAETKTQLGVPYGYTDYEEMLQNKELDAIVIASPSSYHCEQIEKALAAGFHVFSEKPLGLYMEEALRVQEAVHRYPEQVFMLGFMRRYDRSYAYAKRKIEAGAIGEPVLIRCYGLDPAQAMPGFLQFAKSNYSGGLFLDMAIHDLDLARWYLGNEAEQVWAIGGSHRYTELAQMLDAETGAALVKFGGNKMGVFVAGRNCSYGYHIETEIIGTHGTLRIGTVPEKNQVAIMDDRGVVRECANGFLERFEQAYLDEIHEFIRSILEGRQPEVKVEDGMLSTALGYACKESFETGELVKLSNLTEGILPHKAG
ncbi:Gfo/Idh/MocA family oxidoreductase [Paenibacillus larvae]|uniref:Myo-inositol 2-dehydrogenase IolG n=2 Tax=Paenibacillus larvae subsp. larvae TaxID=147375 RepID=V9W4T9_9BACL|nr:Gfo/Idh/MocA family oxidoreductase [Paenibacillus larvae]AHD04650.1 Myo-inositol 2-dehydrogenase IolG [Paenibacillus larvae subsp. larvae DSM 25430]AVG11243.1 Myo-inositol 2-dehydrogenase IolG [Paenibacillus larvae subsp. larvae DSM 25430]MCY9511376.1 Gfo/Idh/MocA family oxidoreductase [Paenibacillus larvae]MCY9527218.1 Gfo/Idh/MocA family oxidoreductase [Paenibacillus larvae]MDR5567013.1 Gfo/Idh/MocA family oxidoreductase [Paenibacillus larvae]